jgi:hypothetical protein
MKRALVRSLQEQNPSPHTALLMRCSRIN